MRSLRVGRGGWASCVVLGLLVPLVSSASAEEDPLAKQRLKLMREAVGGREAESSVLEAKAALTLAPRPLLRYSDPTRGRGEAAGNVLLDAGVWRLGTEGRPTALVTTEIYQLPGGRRLLAYEFLSLSGAKFSLKHKTENVRWEPAESSLTLHELPEAPKPAATAAERLVQMRQLARRFTAEERFRGSLIQCRMLAEPIDRYRSAAQKIVDGGLFAFANGTNPEVGLLLEADGEHWRYAILRLTAAGYTMSLDGRQVAAEDFLYVTDRTGSYHNATHRVDADE